MKIQFTFHNVSINSMEQKCNILTAQIFTFHNVSINSPHLVSCRMLRTTFTFHNVSINSFMRRDRRTKYLDLHSIMYLLIPLRHPWVPEIM